MQHIISQFQLANPVLAPKPLKIGFINDSFILPAAQQGGKSYFLQRINHHIFTNVDGLQRNIQIVTDHIRAKLQAAGEDNIQNKVLQLVPTLDGQLYVQTPEGDFWRIYECIENGHSEERVTPASAELAGEAFGHFQNQLSDIPEGQLCESIPNFHNIEFRLQQLHDAIRDDKAGRVDSCQDIITAIGQYEQEMCKAERLYREGKLPKRVNHCDTKVNNMMFDADGRPLCIVDLDTVMPGFVLSDFGDFMRTAANTGAEDDPNLDNIQVDLEVFMAYTRGYLRTATFLSETERSLLPFGCRLLSYMQAVRFFTDYLNGDTYYKIQYPEHNLVRTRAQWKLFLEQTRCEPVMSAIVSALSNGKPICMATPNAELSIANVNWPDAFPTRPQVTVKINHDTEKISLRYHVSGPDLRAVFEHDHDAVWADSCCEFFCRIPGHSEYFNFEINPIGTMTVSTRTARSENVCKLSAADMQRIVRVAPLGNKAFGEKEGEHDWEIGMQIPFALLYGMSQDEWMAAGSPIPAMLECNFYKCGDDTAHPHFLSWAPIHTPKPDFHRPEFFGLMIL